MTDEQRYTLAEAATEMERRDCAAGGHGVEAIIRDGSSWAGVPVRAYCRCGDVRWTPQFIRPAEPAATRPTP